MTEKKKHAILSIYAGALRWPAMLVFAFYACTHMLGATDTWKAMAAGRHYLSHGVSTLDPFSEDSLRQGPTAQDINNWPAPVRRLAEKVGLDVVRRWHPTGWVNQNWLADILLYWLAYLSPIADAQNLSFNSLVWLKFAIYAATAVCLYYAARVLGAGTGLSAASVCMAMFVARTYLHIRPADFTNLAAVLFILILSLAVRKNILFVWLVVPLLVLWCNLHGGFMYGFVMLGAFAALNLAALALPAYRHSSGLRNVGHLAGAWCTALVAVVVFNPFHLANVTHSFVVTIGPEAKAWQTSEEWASALRLDKPFGDTVSFLVMVAAAAAILLVRVIVGIRVHGPRRTAPTGSMRTDDSQTPVMNVGLVVIAGLTCYMALSHRRFIPLAAISICPVMAMLIGRISSAVAEGRDARDSDYPPTIAKRRVLRLIAAVGITFAIAAMGCLWGLKFKRVYLDCWPPHSRLTSIFMRMTGSYAEPFDAVGFLNENRFTGKIFCYWTQGDFLALFQDPDPNTGKIPLQVFMDSRAQTAYDLRQQDLWAAITQAGPGAERARLRNRQLTDADYEEIARWLDRQLKEHEVSVVLIPASQWEKDFAKALQRAADWRLVYLDDGQKVFVDVRTAQGEKLLEGIAAGQTVYPTDFSRNLIIANYSLVPSVAQEQRKQGLQAAIKALEVCPSTEAMKMIIYGAQFGGLRADVDASCKDYVERFEKDSHVLACEDGYYTRLVAASLAASYMRSTAQKQGDAALADFYSAKLQRYNARAAALQKAKAW